MPFIPYIIKSFRGGISDENDKGIRGSFKHGYGLDIRKRNDTLSAKQAMANVGPSALSGVIRYFVPSSDGSLYAFGANGSIWAQSGTDNAWNLAYNDSNGEIKGAAEWSISDPVTSTIVRHMFWATNTSIARVSLSTGNAVPWTNVIQDYKTTLDSADYHTMRAAAGALMIANGNYLAAIDFEGTFDPSALNLRPGNLIKTLEERDDYVILGSYRSDLSEEGHLWSWVVSALNFVQKKRIPVKGVNALIYAEIPLIQGGDDGELFTSDFTDAVPLHSMGGGGQVKPDGVTIYDDIAHFGMYGGTYPGIWSYGRKRKDQSFSLNFDYRLTPTVAGSTITEIGALTTWSDLLLASWHVQDGSTNTYGIDQVSSTTKATALYEGLEFDNQQPHLEHFYEGIRVRTKPMESGTSLSAKFKLDNETDWRYAVMGNGLTTHAVSAGFSSTIAEFLIQKPGTPYEVGLEINPSGNTTPEVNAVVTYVSAEARDHG